MKENNYWGVSNPAVVCGGSSSLTESDRKLELISVAVGGTCNANVLMIYKTVDLLLAISFIYTKKFKF